MDIRRRIHTAQDTIPEGVVDLGLPSGRLWAKGNLVKDSQDNYSIGNETDYGTSISWGNIIGYNYANYYFSEDAYNVTPGKNVSADIPSNDAAHDICLAKLGSPWHLPTKEDFQELYDNTDNEFAYIYGVYGRKLMKKTDHSIYVFFPHGGYYNSISHDAFDGVRSSGLYWSSSWYSSKYGYFMYFDRDSADPQRYTNRYLGMSVRPVQ